jgi:molecular chaperone GrpE
MKKEVKNKIECEECKELELKVVKLEDEKLIIENQLKKALADYQNLSNNSEKRNELRFFQTRKNLAESVIPSLDSLTLAIDSSKDMNLDENGKSWLSGIAAIFQSLSRSFEDFGLKQYVPEKGTKFDPNIHEAVAMVGEGTSGEIYGLAQPGYILDNTVIRPARVVVSK